VKRKKSDLRAKPAPHKTGSDSALYWWIATNGASVAASPLSLPGTLRVSPTPEQLFGFRTCEEQQAARHVLLTAPIKRVVKYLQEKINRGGVMYVRPVNPEPPPTGGTAWLHSPDRAASSERPG